MMPANCWFFYAYFSWGTVGFCWSNIYLFYAVFPLPH